MKCQKVLLTLVYSILTLNLCSFVESYKILGVFLHPGRSHMAVFQPVMKALAHKGHDVTVISDVPLKTPVPNYREVAIQKGEGVLAEVIDLRNFTGTRFDKYANVPHLHYFAERSCDAFYNSKQIDKYLSRDNLNIDVVIVELFNTDCGLGILAKLNYPPTVGISSSMIMPWTNNRFGNPTHPAYIPNMLLDYSDRMTFWERLENTIFGVFSDLHYHLVTHKQDQNFIRNYSGAKTANFQNMVDNISLVLVNSHHSINFPRPLVPAVVEIGGVHIAENCVKKLPPDLDRWINESTHGVIYFSLGSMIKGHTFPAEKRQEFLRAFGRLPQRILWKWENDTMPGKPDNVMIQKWMPQLDILCHPNVKAFISHGGLLGTTEAVHCGVPIVVMPQFGDQFTNARALEEVGGGVILDLHTATEDKVYDALRTVLQPSFRKGAEELSARFRDRPLPPLETAIYWVEYVARHRGAHHMRTAAVGMPIYKYLLLDVIAFLVIVLAAISAVTFVIARAVLRKIFVKKNKAKTD